MRYKVVFKEGGLFGFVITYAKIYCFSSVCVLPLFKDGLNLWVESVDMLNTTVVKTGKTNRYALSGYAPCCFYLAYGMVKLFN